MIFYLLLMCMLKCALISKKELNFLNVFKCVGLESESRKYSTYTNSRMDLNHRRRSGRSV